MADQQGNAWWKQPGVPKLVVELVRVRSIGCSRLGDIRSTELSELRKKARFHYPNARFETDAIRSLLTDAARDLRMDDPRVADAAEYELGLRAIRGKRQPTPNDRREKAAECLGLSKSTFRQRPSLEQNLLERVADAIERLGRPLDSGQSAVEGSFIFRSELSAAVDTILGMPSAEWTWQRLNLLFIRGEPGCGTSRFAYEHFWSGATVRLPAHSEQTLLLAMCRLLDSLKKRVPGDAVGIRHQFGRLLTTGALNRVLIDDVEDPKDVLAWLPDRLRCQVVIVTHLLPPDSNLAPVVEVGPLSLQQSLDLLSDRCPQLSTDSAMRLSVIFGHRVKALAQLARLMNELSGVDSTELVEALLADPATSLASSAEDLEASLNLLYRRAVQTVADDYPASLPFLDFLAFAGHDNLTERCFTAYMTGGIRRYHTAAARLQFMTGVRPLIKVGLLHIDGERYFLDPLTARLVRHLRSGGADDVVLRVCSVNSLLDEDKDVTLFDLAGLAWTPADIAAFQTCAHLAMLRLDIFGVTRPDSVPTVRTDPNLDISATIMATEMWQWYYFLMRGMELDSNRYLLEWATANLSVGGGGNFMKMWFASAENVGIPNAPSKPPPELTDILLHGVALETLNRWLTDYELPAVRGGRRREIAEAAYKMFTLVRWGVANYPALQVMEAQLDDVDLAAACMEMAKVGHLGHAYASRGARLSRNDR